MDDGAGGPHSLFVVVSYEPEAPCFSTIFRLQLETPKQKKMIQVTENDYVARFTKPEDSPSSIWYFSPPTSSTDYNMYMVQDHKCPPRPVHKPLHGIKFNFSTGECLQIKPPMASKYEGHVVNWKGLVFFMARPDSYYVTPDPVFECYDPDVNKWKALQPFLDDDVYLKCRFVVATAVLDDTILYNLNSQEMWAYNVPKDKWYIVHVEDNLCYDIRGEAVVLENAIYALKGCYITRKFPGLVLVLSIEREEDINGDVVYNCSIRSKIKVPRLYEIKYDEEDGLTNTLHLVHLGGDDFCVVQSCTFFSPSDRYQQPIQLTRIKRTRENSMIVTDIILYEVEVLRGQQFKVKLCFSLPECKTTALEEVKGRITIPLEPNTEGHSVYARNLPPNATFKQLDEEFKKFGMIKRDGIVLEKDNTGNSCIATIEYETAASMRGAIKASPIIIGESQVSLADLCNSQALW